MSGDCIARQIKPETRRRPEVFHYVEKWHGVELRLWEQPQGVGIALELARSDLRPE